jgi:hypothetical protein
MSLAMGGLGFAITLFVRLAIPIVPAISNIEWRPKANQVV